MNSAEIVNWLQDLTARLPNASKWLLDHPDTFQLWREELLSDLEFDDCLEVNRKLMHDGYDAKPWEMDSFGAMVRKGAKQIEHERESRNEHRSRRPDRVSRRGSMARAFGELLQENRQLDRKAILDREFPDEDGPRYRCRLCRDLGLVLVYHPQTVIDAYYLSRGKRSTVTVYTAAAACTCSAGNRYVDCDPKVKGLTELVRYNDRLYLANAVGKANMEQELAAIAEIYVPPNHHSEFDEFNNRP